MIAKVILKNYSANILHLKYTGPFTFHQDGTIFKIEPYGEKSIDIKTLENKPSLELPFELLNGITGRKKCYEIYFQLNYEIFECKIKQTTINRVFLIFIFVTTINHEI